MVGKSDHDELLHVSNGQQESQRGMRGDGKRGVKSRRIEQSNLLLEVGDERGDLECGDQNATLKSDSDHRVDHLVSVSSTACVLV